MKEGPERIAFFPFFPFSYALQRRSGLRTCGYKITASMRERDHTLFFFFFLFPFFPLSYPVPCRHLRYVGDWRQRENGRTKERLALESSLLFFFGLRELRDEDGAEDGNGMRRKGNDNSFYFFSCYATSTSDGVDGPSFFAFFFLFCHFLPLQIRRASAEEQKAADRRDGELAFFFFSFFFASPLSPCFCPVPLGGDCHGSDTGG